MERAGDISTVKSGGIDSAFLRAAEAQMELMGTVLRGIDFTTLFQGRWDSLMRDLQKNVQAAEDEGSISHADGTTVRAAMDVLVKHNAGLTFELYIQQGDATATRQLTEIHRHGVRLPARLADHTANQDTAAAITALVELAPTWTYADLLNRPYVPPNETPFHLALRFAAQAEVVSIIPNGKCCDVHVIPMRECVGGYANQFCSMVGAECSAISDPCGATTATYTDLETRVGDTLKAKMITSRGKVVPIKQELDSADIRGGCLEDLARGNDTDEAKQQSRRRRSGQ